MSKTREKGMNNSNKRMKAIFAAVGEYQAAAKRLVDVVKREIPVGTVLRATDGNARRTSYRALGHSDAWWARPGEITVQNESTLKVRRISAINQMPCIEIEEPLPAVSTLEEDVR